MMHFIFAIQIKDVNKLDDFKTNFRLELLHHLKYWVLFGVLHQFIFSTIGHVFKNRVWSPSCLITICYCECAILDEKQ